MIISHNLTAMNAQREYQITTGEKAKRAERLSSGFKIGRAADDAADSVFPKNAPPDPGTEPVVWIILRKAWILSDCRRRPA